MRSWLICTFLLGSYFASCQFSNPDSLFSEKEYVSAAIGYEWLLYAEKPSGIKRNFYLSKKAECYLLLDEFEKALATLERADYFEKGDMGQLMGLYEQYLITAYLSQNSNAAYRKLLQAKTIFGDAMPYEIAKLEPFILIDLELYEMVNASLKNLSVLTADTSDLKALLEIVDENKLRKTNKAVVLSYILPGTGMAYAGKFGKGVISAGIQAISGAYGLYGVLTGYFFTAAIPGVGLFYTFYTGGARYAGQLAIKRNEILTNRWKQQLGTYLLDGSEQFE